MIIISFNNYHFWKEFYSAFNIIFLHKSDDKNSSQQRIIKLYASILLYEDPVFLKEFLTDDVESDYILLMLIKGVFSSSLLTEHLLYAAEKSKGIFDQKHLAGFIDQIITKGSIRSILGLFLNSLSSRNYLISLLNTSDWLRKTFLKFPESIFMLVKEPKLIKVLLKKEHKNTIK